MVLLSGAAMATVALLLFFGERLAEGPAPITWNKEACAQCRMHIGDKAFAAQLQLTTGEVRSFDDPGCAFHSLAQTQPADLHAVYFRHMTEDRWLSSAEVRFIPAESTPMGYGFGAVAEGAQGSLSLAEVMAKVVGNQRAEATP